MMDRLWGDFFFNLKIKKWINKDIDVEGKLLERVFNMFILDLIFRLFIVIMNFKKDEILVLLEKLEIVLKGDEKDLEGKVLLKVVMRKFLLVVDVLLEMIVLYLLFLVIV